VRRARADDRPNLEVSVAQQAVDQLFPPRQVWVHVDYSGYRQACRSGNAAHSGGPIFLDHVAESTSHRSAQNNRILPAPVPSSSLGGIPVLATLPGGREWKGNRRDSPPNGGTEQDYYADPMDLTKMLEFHRVRRY